MKHPRRTVLLAFVCFFAFAFLFLTLEHFRGPWLLKRWKARMQAKGEILDIDKLAPPRLRPEDNSLPQLTFVSGRMSTFPIQLYPPAGKYAAPGKVIAVTKLNDWPEFDSKKTNINWVQVAEQLAPLEPHIQETLELLATGRFSANLHYHAGFNLIFSHLTRLKSISQILSAAVLHDVHQGHNEAAFPKVMGMLAAAQVEKNEPILISQLVRIAMTHIAFFATWQALQHDGWTDSELAQLQRAWSELTFLREMENAMCMERAIMGVEYQRFRTSDVPLSQLLDPTAFVPGGGGGGPSVLSWDWFMDMFDDFPSVLRDQAYTPIWKFAWSHHDELQYCKIMQRFIDAHREVMAENAGAKLPARVDEIEATAMGLYDRLRFAVAPMLYPALTKAFQRAWIAQTTAELATTALAIRRFQLQRSELPRRLEDLVPEFLPKSPIDLMDGSPLKYCVSDNSFQLYSVGIDGKDDGGDGRNAQGGNPNFQYGQDLVWPEAASELEIIIWRTGRK